MSIENKKCIERICTNFGVALSDEETGAIDTPTQLAQLISRKLSEVDAAICSDQRAFNLIRKSLVRDFNIPYDVIKPESNIVKLVTDTEQKELWGKLKTGTGTTYWPRLKLPFIIHWIVRLADIALYAFFLNTAESVGGFIAAIFWGALLVLIFQVIVYKATFALRNRIDPKVRMIKNLIPIVTTSKKYVWSYAEIEEEIKEVLLEFGVVKEDAFSLDMKL